MAVAVALAGVFLLHGPAAGQIVFDWPVRAEVEPEALLVGAAATLWNPAGTPLAPSEGWLVSVDGPDATDARGVAVAVTAGLPRLGTLGVALSHLGISDIPRTLDSPASVPGSIDVAEDAVVLTLSRRAASWASVGVGARWTRAGVADDDRSRITSTLGVRLAPPVPLRPVLAVAMLGLGGYERVLAAVSTSLPSPGARPFTFDLGYGIDGSTRSHTLEQRVSLRVTWMARYRVGAGLTVPDDEDEGVTPLWMAGADFGRYSLAVLREGLSNDFGAVQYYRIAIHF